MCVAGVAALAHDAVPALERNFRNVRRLERLLSDRNARLARARAEAFALACRMPSFARELVHVYRKANLRARKDGVTPKVFQSEPVFKDVGPEEFGLAPAAGARQ